MKIIKKNKIILICEIILKKKKIGHQIHLNKNHTSNLFK
jgi:hypothetical protein